MTIDKNSTTSPQTPVAKAKAKAAEAAPARAAVAPKPDAKPKAAAKKPKAKKRKRKGLRIGPTPDHEITHKVRVRTQTGWKLYLPAIEFWAPGETENLEVTTAQLEYLRLDGRIMLDGQIDDFEAELASIGDRKKSSGTRVKAPSRKAVPEALAVNRPGGPMLPDVKLPKDAKGVEVLAKEERAALAKQSKAKAKGKR